MDSGGIFRLERRSAQAARIVTTTKTVRPHFGTATNKEEKNEDAGEQTGSRWSQGEGEHSAKTATNVRQYSTECMVTLSSTAVM